jgi:hypothetical protein
MKPIPFAQYMARQQAADAEETPEPVAKAPLSWPPAKKTEAAQKPRVSPLLRKVETEAPPPSRPAPTNQERIEQGRLRAFEDGREAARKELEDERARMRETLADEIETARQAWRAQEADRLAAAHRAALENFETRCAQAVASILRPFLTGMAIARVTESLVTNLEVLFASRTKSLFEISGPADLLDALREKFAGRDASIAWRPEDAIDVRVRVDDTIIETQLGDWMKALGALPADAFARDLQDA